MPGIVYRKIISKARSDRNLSLALTAGEDGNVYVETLDYSNPLQSWEYRQARPDGAFAIINKQRSLCIARDANHQGSHLMLVGLDQIAINDLAVWRHDTVQGTYNAINSYADWEQKIGIPGNGPYRDGLQAITWEWDGGADNELWVDVEDARRATMRSIRFSIDQGVIEDQTPLLVDTQKVVNNTGLEQSQTIRFSFIETHSYSFQQERGLTISEEIEFKAGLPLIGESKVTIKVEGSWKFSETSQEGETKEVEVEVPLRVAPYSAVQVKLLVLRGQLNVPFEAVVRYDYPDGSFEDKSTSGLFIGVNEFNSYYVIDPLGTIPEPAQIKRMPFDRMRQTVRAAQLAKKHGCG